MPELLHTAPLFAAKLAVLALAYSAAATAFAILTKPLEPARRHQVLRLVALGALALPLITALAPPPAPVAPTTPIPIPALDPTSSALIATTTLWLIGTLVLTSRLAAGYLNLRTLRKEATDPSPEHQHLIDTCRRHMAISRPVRVRFAPVATPFVTGIRHPIVFLPLDASTWSTPLLRSAITHEFAHLARKDLAWGTATAAVTTLFWWNPAAWCLARHLVQQRESLSDQLAAERSGLGTTTYAHALIEICSRTSTQNTAAVAAAIRHGSLEQRIRHLCPDRHLASPHPAPPTKPLLALTSAALLFLAAVAAIIATSLRTAPTPWTPTEVTTRWAADPFPASAPK